MFRDCFCSLRRSAFYLCEVCSRSRSSLDSRKPPASMFDGDCAGRRKRQNRHHREDARDVNAAGISSLPVFPVSVCSSAGGKSSQSRTVDEWSRNPRPVRRSLRLGRKAMDHRPVFVWHHLDGFRCPTPDLRALRCNPCALLDSGSLVLGIRGGNCVYRYHSQHRHPCQSAFGSSSIGINVLYLGVHSSSTESSVRVPQWERVDQHVCSISDVRRSLDYCRGCAGLNS